MTARRHADACPAACRSPYRPARCQTAASHQEPATRANDCLSVSRSSQTDRPTRGRAARLRAHLGNRDLAVLEWLYRLRLLTTKQIERLVMQDGSPLTKARRTRALLQRLRDLRLVVVLDRRVGGPRSGSTTSVYGLTGWGQAVIDVQGIYGKRRRRVWETKPAFVDHVLAVSELYVQLTQLTQISPAELVRFDGEPAAWRRFTAVDGTPSTLKLDAFVHVTIGDIERRAFIEVDMGTESLPTIQRKCLSVAAYWLTGTEQREHGIFPVTLWLVPTEARRTRIQSVIDQLSVDTRPLFTVALQADGAGLLAAPRGEVQA